jgi:hypothetical protein
MRYDKQTLGWLETLSDFMYRLNPLYFAIGFLMLFLVSCLDNNSSSETTNVDKMRLFESSEYDFSIEYPAGWIASELPDGNHGDKEVIAMFFIPAPFPGVLIQQKEFKSPALEDIANWGKQRILNRYDEYDLGDLVKTNVGDQEVFERVYRTNMTTGSNLMLRDVYFLHDGKGFILTFVSYASKFDELNPIFQAMVDSFQFDNKEGE